MFRHSFAAIATVLIFGALPLFTRWHSSADVGMQSASTDESETSLLARQDHSVFPSDYLKTIQKTKAMVSNLD